MPNLIKKSPQKEMINEGTTIRGSRFDDVLQHLYVPNRKLIFTGLNEFTAPIRKVNIKPSLISNKAYKQNIFHPQPDNYFLAFQSPGLSHSR